MTVMFTMIDGMRPDAIPAAKTPNLHKLMAEGASTMQARSVMPSVTLPCHMSIFHSVPPTRHGVTSNTWMPMARPVPGLVEQAKGAGLRCAFFYNWEQLRNLSSPGNLVFSYYKATSRTNMGDHTIAQQAAAYFNEEAPDFAFVYFGTVDETGHDHGWMSAEYLAQLERVDEALGLVLAALPEGSSLILQSDHGGHDRSHGTPAPEDMTIPWIVWGPSVKAGYTIQSEVSLLDTAPTLARLLEIEPSSIWEGKCVDKVFK